MLEERVGGEYSVVWLDDGGGHLWAWVDAEPELGLLAVVDRKRLKKEGARARAVPPPVEDHEALETGTLVGKLTKAVESEVERGRQSRCRRCSDHVRSYWRHPPCQRSAALGGRADGRYRCGPHRSRWLKIKVDGTWNVLASASLGEEGADRSSASTDGVQDDEALETVNLHKQTISIRRSASVERSASVDQHP